MYLILLNDSRRLPARWNWGFVYLVATLHYPFRIWVFVYLLQPSIILSEYESRVPSSWIQRSITSPCVSFTGSHAALGASFSFFPPLGPVQILKHKPPNKGFSWVSARIQEALCIHSFTLPGHSPKCTNLGNFPAIQQLGICTSTARTWIWSLFRELRSHKQHGVAGKKKKNLMTTSGTVSTEHMCGLRINSVFEHLNFTVTYFKSTKSTEKEHSKYLKEKKAANTVKPSLVPPSAIPQGTPCIVWRVLNFIVLMLMSDSLRPFGL